MIRNFILTALRNFRRHKGYSTINIIGLATGLTCSFFILLWTQDEMSYDKFWPENDQMVRVMRHTIFGGQKGTGSSMPKPLAQVLKDDYPEITHTVLMSWISEMVLTRDELATRAEGRYFGEDFFKVFHQPMLLGDTETALQDPESIILSASLAERYFGKEWRQRSDVLGTVINIDHRLDAKVTGVIEDIPKTSSIDFDFIIPMQEYIRRNDWLEQWGNNGLRIFARLEKGTDLNAVNAKIKDIIDEHITAWESDVFLQPYTDMYLWSSFENHKLVGGRIEYVRIFLLVALFIILIACINFMNLATARSTQRAREIGVRKAVGAGKWSLARQFIGESVVTSMMAFVIAMAVVLLLLPKFNQLTDKSVSISLTDPMLWLQFGGLALFTGMLAGSYPALHLSSFSVVSILRGSKGQNSRGAALRKGLVVFQFILSIVLIIGTMTVYKQLHYIRNKNLGVDRENVSYIGMEGKIREQYEAFKQELLTKPGIADVTCSSQNPLSAGNNTISVQWDGKADGDNSLFHIFSTDYDFLKTMKITLADGRMFSKAFGADSSNYVVNEAALKTMNMDSPLGQRLKVWGREGMIVGVMKDFHMRSLYSEIKPVILRLSPQSAELVYFRIAAGMNREAKASIEEVYRRINPGFPFNLRYLDDNFKRMYRSESVIGTLANIFAVMAVLIASLGLLGLASFTAEQRAKEIAIRKVLGSSVPGIIGLLSKEFIILVVGAYAVALPIAWWLMSRWLNDFAFHTSLSLGIMLGSGVLCVVIAWLNVSYQSIRAAMTNPVVSLRAE